MMQMQRLPIVWTPIDVRNADSEKKIAERLAAVLHSWEDTPYSSTQAVRGVGVYCTAFVCGVLDDLYRVDEPTPLNKIPHDVSMHCGASARAGLRWFMRHYPCADRLWSITSADEENEIIEVQPGDVLITGPVGGGPGHAIMIGPRKNVMWQASGSYVHYTGFGVPVGNMLYAVYRFSDRERWI